MSGKFYTNVQCVGNNILYRGYNNGRRVESRIEYSPSLYIPTSKPTEFRSLQDEPLQQKVFGTIREARDFVKKYDGVSGHEVYGNQNYEYAFIADMHPKSTEWDPEDINIGIVDIEVGSDDGFPEPHEANSPVTAITVTFTKGMKTYALGCGDYQTVGDEVYVKCKDEWSLLKKYLEIWNYHSPDVISGWNVKFFDIPYLVNRITKICGGEDAKRMSPWGIIQERHVFDKWGSGADKQTHMLSGISCLDYMELFKWFAKGGRQQSSFRLDAIAQYVLGEGKLSYEEFDSLHDLYKRDYQKFIEYNIRDVELIHLMDAKLKLFDLAMSLAYDTKSNFEDIFKQTRMWDALTYSYLKNKNIISPPKEHREKDSAFEGAYVKEVLTGMFGWVASFDLDSLYPHLIMQYNISPDTLIDASDYTPEMRNIISQGVTVDKLLKKEIDLSELSDVTMTPNGQFFRTDKRGFLAQMMEEMYDDRKKFKRMMLDYKQQKENEKDPAKRKELDKLISKYDNLQNAKKLSLNSAYGALGSQYFRFYDLRMALAVTTAGQFSIRWIENKLNEYMNGLLNTDKDYVIASDTDSIYLNFTPLVHKIYGDGDVDPVHIIDFMDRACEQKIQPYIDESYNELAEYVNAYHQKMKMKREALARNGIWTGKKHYILDVYDNEGVRYAQPDLKVMGLEMVKSSTPDIIRTKMKEAIVLIVRTDEQTVQDYITTFREQFNHLPIEEIASPRGVSDINKFVDPVTLYRKSTPIHVKGAILHNHYIKEKGLTKKYPLIKEGEKLKYVLLKTPNPFKDSVVAFQNRLPTEFGLEKHIDYDTMFDKTFLDPIKGVLNVIGWKAEKVNSLEDFFG